MLCIHEAGSGELKSSEIRDMLADCVGDPDQDDNLSRAVALYERRDYHLLVGALHQRPIAILGYREDGETTEIAHLAVRRDYRGINIGRRMIAHISSLRFEAQIRAETDAEAVGFYRACGFECESLGEKYPCIERFSCTLVPPRRTRRVSVDDIEFLEVAPDRLELIRPLWSKLNRHHYVHTIGWKEHFSTFSFEARGKRFSDERKRLRIDIAKDRRTGNIVGYNISSIDPLGVGEIESIFVEEAYRGLHLGETLMRRGMEWLDGKGAHDITIVVAVGNEEALPFYERLGFRPRTYRLKRCKRNV